jgi:hypothetical protein
MKLSRVLVLLLPLWSGALGKCLGQDLSASLAWEIGGMNGPEEVMWMRINDGVILRESVYVVDTHDPSVRQFSLQGIFLREFGRSGAGPGEFLRPSIIASRGDSIGVWDFMQRRWTFFDEEGNHLRTRNIPVYPQMRYRSLHRPFRRVHGFYAGLTGWIVDDGVAYPEALVQWSEPTRVDTVGLIPQGAIMAFTWGQWNRVSQGVGPVGGVDALGDSLIVFVDGHESRMTAYSRTESGLRAEDTQRLPGQPVRLSQGEQDDLVNRLIQNGPAEYARREYRVPELVPVWTSVRASAEGTVWLRRGGTGGLFGSGETWVAWSLTEGMIGELTLSPGVHVLDVEGDLLIAKRRGEFDELYLQLFRIEGTGG